MIFKEGLKTVDIDWNINPVLLSVSSNAKKLLRIIENKNINDLSDSSLSKEMSLSASSIKKIKTELRNAGLFVTQKTRSGYDYYIGYECVNMYIIRYGKTLDPNRISKKYESYDERISREDYILTEISHNAMRREGLL